MKQKVTLSLKPEVVAKLKAERRRRSTTMSEEVERRVEADEAPPEGPSPFMKWVGKFADWFTEEDFENDDWIGHELRNTDAYQRMKQQRKSA